MKIIRTITKNIITEPFYYLKDKVLKAWIWTKQKAKKILIALGIITIALAAGNTLMGDLKDEVSLEKIQQKYEQAIELKAKYQMEGASLIRNEIKNPELDAYKGEPKDEVKITIGDKDKTEFVPNVELKRWNEVSFKIKTDNLLADVATKDKDLKFEGEKIRFDTPKMSFEMYEFTEGEGGYKFIWYLNEKPLTNKVEFQLESSGLDFFYQPPLTQEYQNGYSEEFQKEIVVSETQVKDLDGNVLVERPENVVGSYAVYHQTKGGMNDINGKEYKTGQMGMIYPSHLIDAEGKTGKAILTIDVANGTFTEEIPQNFLDKAVYPIRGNTSIGYETKGGSNTSYENFGQASDFPSADGTGIAINIWLYIGNSTQTTYARIYNRTTTNTITNSNVSVTGITKDGTTVTTINYSTAPNFVSGVEYMLAFSGQSIGGTHSVFYNAGDAGQSSIYTGGYSLPSNSTSWTLDGGTNKYSIYATYTPAGGGATPNPQGEVQIQKGKLNCSTGKCQINLRKSYWELWELARL
jgi:hypothetical protein